MIWISLGRWVTKSDSMFIWERIYRNGNRWTPFIMAKIRYSHKLKSCEPVSPPSNPPGLSDLEGYYGKDVMEKMMEKPASFYESIVIKESPTMRRGGMIKSKGRNDTYRVWTNPKKKYLQEVLQAANTFNLVKYRPKSKVDFPGGWTYPSDHKEDPGMIIVGYRLSPGAEMTNYSLINTCKLMSSDSCCPFLVCGSGGFACGKTEDQLLMPIKVQTLLGAKSHCHGVINARYPLNPDGGE